MRFSRSPLSQVRWLTRAWLWTFSALAGLAVVGFAKLADLAFGVFVAIQVRHPWAPFVLSPVIGVVTVWATRRYFPGAQGSGIPQVIAAARLVAQNKAARHLVSLRIAVGKIGLGALALTGGFAAGREGPSVQVAASLLQACHRFLPHTRAIRLQDLILAGGAAGVAAAFNTPLAGIVFAGEELGRRLETRTSGIVMSVIILSGLVAVALLGNYNYFGHLKIGDVGLAIVKPLLFCGICCGLLGGLFSRLLLWPLRQPACLLWRWRASYPLHFAAGCGLAVALLGWLSDGIAFGSGYAITEKAISGAAGLPWHALLFRYAATLVSYFSGIPGGIFSPALSIGAALGADISMLFPALPSATPILALCMAGFLAAITQAPITSAIIVMEMIDGHNLALSLLTVALLAKAISSRISPELYQRLSLEFLPPTDAATAPRR